MKKLISLLTALMMICSMSMTAAFAEGEDAATDTTTETTTTETMPITDTSEMTNLTPEGAAEVAWSSWYVSGKTDSSSYWDTYAYRVMQKNSAPHEFDNYVVKFASKVQSANYFIVAFGGTADKTKAYYYGGKNPTKGTLTISPTTIKFRSGSITQEAEHGLAAGAEYELYISYVDGTIVYGIKAKDAEDSTYVWNTASDVALSGTIINRRENCAVGTPMTISSMYAEKELAVSIPDGLYDINPGSIAVTAGSTLAETLGTATISDGTNSVECTVTRTDDTTATITIPDGTLAYDTRYCIDLSQITDADGIAAKKLYFGTVNLSADAYKELSGITQSWYDNTATPYSGKDWYWTDSAQKLGLFKKDGEPLAINDFMLSFDYTDGSDISAKYLNVIFGVKPGTAFKTSAFAAANNFNGLAGISKWNGKKYKMFFGNTTSTNYYLDGGTTHDLDMAKGKTYNVNLTYVNKVMTMHVKTSDENVWRKYTKTMSDDYAAFEDGYMGFLANFIGEPKNIKLYEHRKSNAATIADGLYDVNPGEVDVTFEYALGTLPSTVAINDADGNKVTDAAIAASTADDKTAVITVPADVLAYGTTYTVDLSAVKDFAKVPASNASFTTLENPVPDDMVQMSGVTYTGYSKGSINAESYKYYDGADNVAVLTKDGENVRVNDFVLTFNYYDGATTTYNKYLNVVFGVNPETATTTAAQWAKANNFNGLAGISKWNGSKYKMFFGNTTSTNFYKDGGTVHDLTMEKGATYNVKVSYIDKVMTLYVKKSTEATWRKYVSTMTETDEFKEIQNGYIGICDQSTGWPSGIKLYTPVEDYTVSAPSYDKESVVNGETVTVTASVTKNKDTAAYSSTVLMTGLYKKVNDAWVFEKAVSDSAELTTGTPSPLSNSIDIPAEGTYKLKSFIWNLDSLYPYCEAAELTVAE